MEFGWSADQDRLREATLAFASQQLNDDLVRRDREATFSRVGWDRCAKFGIHGLPIPKEFGGQGRDLVTTVLVLEALGRGCRDNGLLFSINAHLWATALPILKFGSTDQQTEYLPGLCAGTAIGAHAVTEAGSGSDALAVEALAEKSGGGYSLSGVKRYITNAPIADVFIVLANVRSDSGSLLPSAFIVPRALEGVAVSEAVDKLGLRTAAMGEVTFAECRLSSSALLGEEGSGTTVFQTTIEWERAFILATALGSLDRQIDDAVAFARTHVRFGSPIGDKQAVSHRIADMRVRLESARLLLYNVAWLKDQGRRTPLESAIAKLFVSTALRDSSVAAFETRGAAAYMSGSPEERDVRDSLASGIYSGTSDVLRNVIARLMGL